MGKDLILKYITITLAIKVLKQDKEQFSKLKFGYLYQDLIDTAIKRMEQDYYHMKGKMYNVVKRLDNTHYNIKGEVIEYTPEQLRDLTRKTIEEYFSGPVEWKEHLWKDKFDFSWDKLEL